MAFPLVPRQSCFDVFIWKGLSVLQPFRQPKYLIHLVLTRRGYMKRSYSSWGEHECSSSCQLIQKLLRHFTLNQNCQTVSRIHERKISCWTEGDWCFIFQLRDSFKELKKRFSNLKFNYLKRNDRTRNTKATRNQLQQVELYEEKLQASPAPDPDFLPLFHFTYFYDTTRSRYNKCYLNKGGTFLKKPITFGLSDCIKINCNITWVVYLILIL